MVILDGDKYVVHVPERGIWQDRDPATGLPFAGEQEAQAWQDAYISAFDADLLAQQATRAAALAAEEAARPKRKILTRYEFRSLFSLQEQIAITTAAKTDVMVEVFMESMRVAQEIDLEYPETVQGLDYLVTEGLIPDQKRIDILMGV